MRNISLFSVLFLFFINVPTNFAQTKFESDDPLVQLLDTEFMMKFSEMRIAAISTARSFKSQQEMYTPQNIRRVGLAYNETAEKFNFVLRGLKEDLMDKKKLKYIQRYPDDYKKELELDLYKLSDFYANNYQQVLADVTNSQVDGSAVLLLIGGILESSYGLYGIVKNIVNFVNRNKKMKQYFSEQRLEKVLIKPYTWPLWSELDNTNSEYSNDNYNQQQDPSMLYSSDQDATFSPTILSADQMKTKAEFDRDKAEARRDELLLKQEIQDIKDGKNISGDDGIIQEGEGEGGFGEGLDENGNPIPPSEDFSIPETENPNTNKNTQAKPNTKKGAVIIKVPNKKNTRKPVKKGN